MFSVMKNVIACLAVVVLGTLGAAGCAADAEESETPIVVEKTENVGQTSQAMLTLKQCQYILMSGGYSKCYYDNRTGACDCVR